MSLRQVIKRHDPRARRFGVGDTAHFRRQTTPANIQGDPF